MSIDPTITRRALLVAGAAGAGTVVIASCSAGSAATGGAQPPHSGPAAAGGRSGGSAAGKTQRSAQDQPLTTLGKIPVGQAVSVQLPDGKPAIVARPTATTAVAFSAICTHMGCTVVPAGKQLDCPCHGSVYDALTGKVLQGPAPTPLPKVPVKVSGQDVVAL